MIDAKVSVCLNPPDIKQNAIKAWIRLINNEHTTAEQTMADLILIRLAIDALPD